MNKQRQLWILGGLSIVVVALAWLLPSFSQPANYHDFADRRSFFGIPNFNDVMSNLGFFFSAAAGIVFLFQIYRMPVQRSFAHLNESLPYWVLFLSVGMVTFGSIGYHLAPDNDRLVWDRLPIVIALTALLSATLVERIDRTAGLWALPIMAILAALSAGYWYWTELQGKGNLNFYIVTQFYSITIILWISSQFPSRYSHANDIYLVIALYGVAKVAEMLDKSIFVWTQGYVSGHTLKHLIAAYAVYRIVQMLQQRRVIQPETVS
ncbi:alkaline phytoceramidase [Nitrosomonas sp. JL21]|nr:alkaline phytoceramidase [Nitrosomonas sp. JL21]MBL8498374.1 alkaline phytoceramidase [Nitrosomonas sp.]MXS78202.1 alkaline phytoceramidase [Nitrosomonas sp. JL21]